MAAEQNCLDAGSVSIQVESVYGSMADFPHFTDPRVSLPESHPGSPGKRTSAAASTAQPDLASSLQQHTGATRLHWSSAQSQHTAADADSAVEWRSVASDSSSDFSYGSDSEVGSDDSGGQERHVLRNARKALQASRRAARKVRCQSQCSASSLLPPVPMLNSSAASGC